MRYCDFLLINHNIVYDYHGQFFVYGNDMKTDKCTGKMLDNFTQTVDNCFYNSI